MAKLISKQHTLTNTFISLLKKYNNISFATAWATSGHDAFSELLHESHKISISTIGLHFYQTSPDVLEKFLESEKVKFMLQTDGVFHPKIYLFWNHEDDWEVIIGSGNFTNGAFKNGNSESMVLLTSNSVKSNFFHEIKSLLESYFNSATKLNNQHLEKYKLLFKTRKPKIQTLSNSYSESGEMKNSIVETDILTYQWDEYFEKIKVDQFHGFQGRLDLLKTVRSLFQQHNGFSDIDLSKRKFISGFSNSAYPEIDAKWFGSTNSNFKFPKAINSNSKYISEALDNIPLSGKISKNEFLEYIRTFQAEPEFKTKPNSLGVSTRLLSMKRPDLFFCCNNANRTGICKDLGIRNIQKLNAERYWDEILLRIYDSPWFNIDKPSDSLEFEAWQNRVALLDCIYYKPKANP